MKKHISLILSVIMLFSLCVPAAAAEANDIVSSPLQLSSNSLRINSVNQSDTKGIISLNAAYSTKSTPELSIEIDNSFLHSCSELNLSVFDAASRDPIFEYVFSIGKEVATVKGLSLDTTYRIMAQGMYGVSVDSFIGQFILYEKSGQLSVSYDILQEARLIREKTEPYIRQLRVATEMLDAANKDFACYDRNSGTLIRSNLPAESIEALDSAAELVSTLATASIRYESESNNTISTAYRVYDDDTTYGTIGYNGDVDYYKVQFSSDGNANFWLGDIPAGQDYDFYLYNASGTQLSSSTTTSNQEQIFSFEVSADTWYYMKVIGYNGSYDASNYYQVRAKNYPTATAGDSYEPNDSYATASSITNNTTITAATLHDEDDVDFFKIVVSSTSTISISLSNIPSSCDYDLHLYNGSYAQCKASTNGGNSSESISYSASPGTYYIKVSSYDGSSSTKYRLAVSTEATFTPDAYENNNTTGTATVIAPPATVYATMHNSTDVDYYKLTLTDGKQVNITLSNIPSGCDYDLQLLQGTTVIARSANSSNSTESISTPLAPGTYYIKVFSYSGSSNTQYRLYTTLSAIQIYGNFSKLLSNPTVPDNITTPLEVIEEEYDVWPAGEISMFYNYSTTLRVEYLTQIYEAALLTTAGGIFLPPASSYLWHFLTQDGDEKTIDVADFMSDDDTAAADRDDEINAVLEAAEYIATAGYTTTFCSREHHEFLPSVMGWNYSIGTYSSKVKCTVTKSGSTYSATIEYFLYDVYDWDRTQTSMGNLPVSPQEMWELQYGGLAKGYYSHGSQSYTVTWTAGQRIGTGAVMS